MSVNHANIQRGLHKMTHTVERNLLYQLIHELRARRPGANSTHLAIEDIEELGKFVYMCLSQKASFTENGAPHYRPTSLEPRWVRFLLFVRYYFKSK